MHPMHLELHEHARDLVRVALELADLKEQQAVHLGCRPRRAPHLETGRWGDGGTGNWGDGGTPRDGARNRGTHPSATCRAPGLALCGVPRHCHATPPPPPREYNRRPREARGGNVADLQWSSEAGVRDSRVTNQPNGEMDTEQEPPVSRLPSPVSPSPVSRLPVSRLPSPRIPVSPSPRLPMPDRDAPVRAGEIEPKREPLYDRQRRGDGETAAPRGTRHGSLPMADRDAPARALGIVLRCYYRFCFCGTSCIRHSNQKQTKKRAQVPVVLGFERSVMGIK